MSRIFFFSMAISLLAGCQTPPEKKHIKETEPVTEDTNTIVKYGNYSVGPLTRDRKAFISRNDSIARILIKKYLGHSHSSYEPDTLDAVIKKWKENTAENKEPYYVIERAIGVALGEYMIREMDVEWKNVYDSWSTDLAIEHKKYIIHEVPFVSIRNIIEDENATTLREKVDIFKRKTANAEKNFGN